MFKIELTIPTNKVKKNSFQHRGCCNPWVLKNSPRDTYESNRYTTKESEI